MKLIRVALAEAWHRRLTAGLTTIAVAAAVAAVIFFITMSRASANETRIIQRDAGLNVRIISSAENLDRYWARGWSEATMPEAYIDQVRDQSVANRLIPLLHRRIEWTTPQATAEIMLTGLAEERFIGSTKKHVFGMDVEPGRIRVGSAVAETLSLQRGQTVELMGESFIIDAILAQTGTMEDARVYASLADVQNLLGLPGRINEIQALECHCSDDEPDPLKRLQNEIESLLPGTRVIRHESMAQARLRQRSTAERFVTIGSTVILILCAAWIGALSMINVQDRVNEIGMLRAVGFSRIRVVMLLLMRNGGLGLLGAVAGALLGGWIATALGPSVFKLSPKSVSFDVMTVGWAIVLAPLMTIAAGWAPAMVGATRDPARTMIQE